MYFSGTVKNLKGEGIKGATVDVVSHDSWHLRHLRPLTISTVASRRRRCLRHPVPDREEPNDRGKILANPDGTFSYRGILPTAYPIVRAFMCFRSRLRLTLSTLA